VDKSTGLRFDQTVVLTGIDAQRDYPVPMRRIGYRDPETGKGLVFLTNNFTVPALTITQLYRGRWQIELFFKWIKQHLRIKAFYGTSPNAVRVQIWTAIAVYLLVAILKKRLHLDASLYTILQILSLTLFEKMPISQALAQLPPTPQPPDTENHQCLLGF
jgi:IS4 transposase